MVPLVFSLTGCSSGSSTSTVNARDYFYKSSDGQQGSDATGGTSVAYKLELRRGDSEPVFCDNRFAFKSGDALKLHLKVNKPLYCYVLNQGSTGEKQVLYPKEGDDNKLQPDSDCVVPNEGEMVFDDNAGTERLIIVLTKEPLAQDKALGTPAVAVDSSALNGSPNKVGNISVLSSFGNSYELGKPVSGDNYVYVSNPERSGPTAVELALKHTKDGESGAPGSGTTANNDTGSNTSTTTDSSATANNDSSSSSGSNTETSDSSATLPHSYGFIPEYMLKDLAQRNPSVRSLELTIDQMQSIERESPMDRAIPSSQDGNSAREVYDARGQKDSAVKARFEGDPPSGKFEVDTVYDFTGQVRSFYKEVFNRNSIDDKGMKYISIENYSHNMENAFWDGRQMTYGSPSADSPFATFALIDVCGHEITHGVTANTQPFDYFGQSGALNESISDVFGELIKQRAGNVPVNKASWAIGEGCWKAGIHGKGLRNMLHPGTAYDDPRLGKDMQPDHMKNYLKTQRDQGGVHLNSGIPNRAFALFALSCGGHAWEKPAKIWYEARALCNTHPSFGQFAYNTIEAAKKLNYNSEVSKLEKAWSAVGVVPSATAVDTLTPGTPHARDSDAQEASDSNSNSNESSEEKSDDSADKN